MRKAMILLVASVGLLTAHADDYPYLMFQATDGTTTAVASSSLTITFADGDMTVTDGTTTQTLPLTSLSKMFFSADATGIEDTKTQASDEAIEVFTLTGISVGKYKNMQQAQNTLERGIYVVKSKNRTLKIAVK